MYVKCGSSVRIISMLETCTCVPTDNLHVDSSWKSKTSTFYKHTSAIFFFTFKSSTSFMSSIDSSTLPSAPTKMNTQSFKIISYPMTCKESQQASLNPQVPKSDKHLISPNSTTSESNIKVARMKEMVMNSRSSWLLDKLSLWEP